MTVAAGMARGALGSAVVVALLAAVVFGLPAIDRSLPGYRAVSSTSYLAVSDTVELLPPPGSQLDVGVSRPGTRTGQVRLLVPGGSDYRIVVRPFVGGVDLAAGHLRDKVRNIDRALTVRPATGGTCAGNPCAIGDYRDGSGRAAADREATGRDAADRDTSDRDAAGRETPGRCGWYAVLLVSGRLVEVVTAGTPDRLAEDRSELERLLDAVRTRAAR